MIKTHENTEINKPMLVQMPGLFQRSNIIAEILTPKVPFVLNEDSLVSSLNN